MATIPDLGKLIMDVLWIVLIQQSGNQRRAHAERYIAFDCSFQLSLNKSAESTIQHEHARFNKPFNTVTSHINTANKHGVLGQRSLTPRINVS